MGRLYLHIPSYEELNYRKELLSQEATMSYNKGFNLDLDNYNNETGCIDFKLEYWSEWYNRWINNEPTRYYAYLTEKDTNEFIGEVNLNYIKEDHLYNMGIVIEDKYRGKGYCIEGLNLLTKMAFENLDVNILRNDIPIDRISAIKGHKKVGFKELEVKNNISYLQLDKEDYLRNR